MKPKFKFLETLATFLFMVGVILTVISYVGQTMWLIRSGYVSFITASVIWFISAIFQPSWWIIQVQKKERLRCRAMPTVITLTVLTSGLFQYAGDALSGAVLALMLGGVITVLMAWIWFHQWFDFHRK